MSFRRSYLLIVLFFSYFHLFAGENANFSPDSISMQIWGEEVEITGKKSTARMGTMGGKITITPANVSNLPSVLGNPDLLKLLELTPSVQNPGDANTNIYIRGGEAGQNLLLYNGVPLYTPGHLLGFFPLFNSDHISTLELNKTGIHSKYGGRLSSVINVEGKNTLPTKAGISGNVGLLASQATLSVPIGKKQGVYLSGRKTYMNFLIGPILDDKIENANYDFYDTNITWIGEFSANNKITVNAFFGSDKLQLSEDELYLDGKLNWSNRSLALQWDTKVNGKNFSQQVYGSKYENKLNVSQAEIGIRLSSSIQDIGYRNSYAFSIAKIPMEAGMQYAHHEITPQMYNMRNMEQIYFSETPPVQNAHEGGLYLHSSIPLTSQLNAEFGVRYNLFYQEKFFHSLDPRIMLRYYPASQIALRLSYDRQHQYMNLLSPSSVGIPTDFWVAVSNYIPPQSGDQFSAGYTQSFFNSKLEFSAEIYYRNMNNLTEYAQNFLNRQNNSYAENILTNN